MFKTMWPLKKYYMLKEDLLYYKKRHDDLNELLCERNKQLNKYRLEIENLWKDKVNMTEHISTLEGKNRILEEKNIRLAETVTIMDSAPCDETPIQKDKGVILEIEEGE